MCAQNIHCTCGGAIVLSEGTILTGPSRKGKKNNKKNTKKLPIMVCMKYLLGSRLCFVEFDEIQDYIKDTSFTPRQDYYYINNTKLWTG